MTDATGAAPDTQRCPACVTHLPLDAFSPAAQGRSGAYCRTCRTARTRQWRHSTRVHTPLPAAELARLRAMVACLKCGAVPAPRVVGGKRRVHTPHTKGCSARDIGIRKTG